MKIIVILFLCVILTGCSGAQLKEGGLYVNQHTCLGMDDLGVAKVKQHF